MTSGAKSGPEKMTLYSPSWFSGLLVPAVVVGGICGAFLVCDRNSFSCHLSWLGVIAALIYLAHYLWGYTLVIDGRAGTLRIFRRCIVTTKTCVGSWPLANLGVRSVLGGADFPVILIDTPQRSYYIIGTSSTYRELKSLLSSY